MRKIASKRQALTGSLMQAIDFVKHVDEDSVGLPVLIEILEFVDFVYFDFD